MPQPALWSLPMAQRSGSAGWLRDSVWPRYCRCCSVAAAIRPRLMAAAMTLRRQIQHSHQFGAAPWFHVAYVGWLGE